MCVCDLFYITRSLVVPSVDYLNINKTKPYDTKGLI